MPIESKPKSLFALLVTLACGGAALFYENAPDGPWKDAAGVAVGACEAAGVAARPHPSTPCPEPVPTPPGLAPKAPALVPEPTWLEPALEQRRAKRSPKPRAGLPSERWRGESRGWARA